MFLPARTHPSALVGAGEALTEGAPTHERITGSILAAFFAVWRELGFGFLESVYTRALVLELMQRGLEVEAESPMSVFYKGTKVGFFRAALVVEGCVVVEVRTRARIEDADRTQLHNHVRCAQAGVGLLLLFGPQPEFRRIAAEHDAPSVRVPSPATTT